MASWCNAAGLFVWVVHFWTITTMTKQKNPVGRPSELAQSLENAKAYLIGGYETVGEVVPNIAGLACYLGKSRSRIYVYAEQSEEFKDILEGILSLQESKLINNGLKGDFNPTIAKLILTKHGYSDKQELSGPDGGPMQVKESRDLSGDELREELKKRGLPTDILEE